MFIDKFCEALEKKTILVLDNSSIHTSNALLDKQEEWKEKGLILLVLPTALSSLSPEEKYIILATQEFQVKYMIFTIMLGNKPPNPNAV